MTPPPPTSREAIEAHLAKMDPGKVARFLPGGVGPIHSIFHEDGKWVRRNEETGEIVATGDSVEDVAEGTDIESAPYLPGETPEQAFERVIAERRARLGQSQPPPS